MSTKLTPLVHKPAKINNITHCITLLKLKQEKYKNYTCDTIQSKNLLYTFKGSGFNYDEII